MDDRNRNLRSWNYVRSLELLALSLRQKVKLLTLAKYCGTCKAVPHQDRHSLRSEVPTRMAILHKSARSSRHKDVYEV